MTKLNIIQIRPICNSIYFFCEDLNPQRKSFDSVIHSLFKDIDSDIALLALNKVCDFFLKLVFCFRARIGFYKFLDAKQRNYFKRPNVRALRG